MPVPGRFSVLVGANNAGKTTVSDAAAPALRWPHRVTTLDTLIYSLLEYLLETGQVRWPGGHRRLDVHDSWKAITEYFWIRGVAGLQFDCPVSGKSALSR